MPSAPPSQSAHVPETAVAVISASVAMFDDQRRFVSDAESAAQTFAPAGWQSALRVAASTSASTSAAGVAA